MSYRFPFTPKVGEAVPWSEIAARFEWVRAMRGVQQEPEWHAEGDVFVHTKLVCEALAGLVQWREAGETDREVLFAAALLHDVAKPVCTVEENGRWTSPKHTVVGERLARELLMTGKAGETPVFFVRERIAKLVRYHGLPLRFLDKPDPERVVIECSQHVNVGQLVTLVRADVLGRECAGKDEMLMRVAMFEQLAQELGCADRPYPFESAQHRFMYFVGGKPLTYVPYPETRCEVVLMSGLPASGKSTWVARNFKGMEVISPDAIREELDIEPTDRDGQGKVAQVAKARAKELLRAGKGFVWDATNISRDMRGQLVALCAGYGATVRVIYVESSVDEMLRRNRNRARQVPEAVMVRMLQKLEIPSVTEAHNVEYVT